MAVERNRFVTVFTTGQVINFNAAVGALEQAGIPHQMQEETASGLRLAMPAFPTGGPGTFYSVQVPAAAVAEARRALSRLPFEIATNPGPWDFSSRPRATRALKICLIIVVLGAVALGIYEALRALIG